MPVLYTLLILLEALTSFFLIGVIFLQKTKGGMGSALGGGGMGEAIFGARMGNVLTKATVILCVIFLVNTTLLAYLTANLRTTSVTEGIATQPVMPAMPSPTAPVRGVPSDVDPFGPGTTEMPEPVSTPTVPAEPIDLTTPVAEPTEVPETPAE